ncbi:MAG: hypothetical protein PHQ23_04730 [Candidatus Wallbacteria bacterium]|nr:hypothetical protein [Candidatus Wallbacteria bacterium]
MKLLNLHEVEYLIVGGYAVGMYGYPRATGDLDIWIAVNASNAGKALKVLHEFGMSDPGATVDLFMEKNKNQSKVECAWIRACSHHEGLYERIK